MIWRPGGDQSRPAPWPGPRGVGCGWSAPSSEARQASDISLVSLALLVAVQRELDRAHHAARAARRLGRHLPRPGVLRLNMTPSSFLAAPFFALRVHRARLRVVHRVCGRSALPGRRRPWWLHESALSRQRRLHGGLRAPTAPPRRRRSTASSGRRRGSKMNAGCRLGPNWRALVLAIGGSSSKTGCVTH